MLFLYFEYLKKDYWIFPLRYIKSNVSFFNAKFYKNFDLKNKQLI